MVFIKRKGREGSTTCKAHDLLAIRKGRHDIRLEDLDFKIFRSILARDLSFKERSNVIIYKLNYKGPD